MTFKQFMTKVWAAIKPTADILASKTGQALLNIAVQGFTEAYANGQLKTADDRRNYVLGKLKQSDLTTNNAITDAAVQIILAEAEHRFGHK